MKHIKLFESQNFESLIDRIKRTAESIDPLELKALSKDINFMVRRRVAKNSNTTIEVLLDLVKDEIDLVANDAKDALRNRDVLGDLLGD